MVTLELTQGVYIYQQAAVVTAIIIVFFSLIFIKTFHIRHILALEPHTYSCSFNFV